MKTNLTGNLKQCVAKRKKLNNKGVAMISALMMVVIFSIIGTSILSIAINQVTNSAEKEIAFTSKYALTQAAECVLDVIEGTNFIGHEAVKSQITDNLKTSTTDDKLYADFELIINGASSDPDKPAPSYVVTIEGLNCVPSETSTDNQTVTVYTIVFKAVHESVSLEVDATLTHTVTDGNATHSISMVVTSMTYGE